MKENIEKNSSVFSFRNGNYRKFFLGFFLPFRKLPKKISRFFPSQMENIEKNSSVFSFPNLTFWKNSSVFSKISKSDVLEIFLGFFSVFSESEGKNRIPPYGGNLGKFPSCGRHGKKDSGREGLRPPSLEDLFPCRD